MKKVPLLAFLLIALLLTPVLMAQNNVIERITYTCVEDGLGYTIAEITVHLANGRSFNQSTERSCTDAAVARQVAFSADIPDSGEQFIQLASLVERDTSFAAGPFPWLGANWGNLLLGIFATILLFSNVFTIRQQEEEIIERLGKYVRTVRAGLNLKIPFFEARVAKFDLRLKPNKVKVDTKTEDSVFLAIEVDVQTKVIDSYRAYYEPSDFDGQLQSYVFDEVRAAVPHMKFDDVFQNKEVLADRVKQALLEKLEEFGYLIVDVLVTDITPPEEIEVAMNEVVAQEKQALANEHKGEADKILIVKEAEAKKERDQLMGEGIAAFRMAVADGTRVSMEQIKKGAPELSDNAVSALLLATQWFDTLEKLAAGEGTRTIYLPNSPGAGMDIMTQMHAAMEDSLELPNRSTNGRDTVAAS